MIRKFFKYFFAPLVWVACWIAAYFMCVVSWGMYPPAQAFKDQWEDYWND